MSYKNRELVIDAKYTVVGSTSIPDSVSFTLKAGGLKHILEQCTSDEDLIHIESFSDRKWSIDNQGIPQCKESHYTHMSISKHED